MPKPRAQEHDYTKAKSTSKKSGTNCITCSNCSVVTGEKDFVQHVLVEGQNKEKSMTTVLNGLSAICGLKLSTEFLNSHAEQVTLCRSCGSLFAHLYKLYIQFMSASASDSFIKKLVTGKIRDKASKKVQSSFWDSSGSEDEFEKASAPSPKRARTPKRLPAAEPEPILTEPVVHDPSKPKTHKCSECGMIFGDVWEWVSHIETHPVGLDLIKKPRGKPKSRAKSLCTLCGRLFTCIDTHMQASHAEKEFKCLTCNKAFSFQRQLERHIQQVHISEKEVYPCRHCGKLYQDKRFVQYHELTHDANYIAEKPFKCGECEASFQFKAGLTLHSVKHVRTKAFSCTICFRKFAQKALLNNHMEYHKRQEEQTSDQCIFCGRGYTLRQRLRDHLMSCHEMTLEDATELAGVEDKKRVRTKTSLGEETSVKTGEEDEKVQEYSDPDPKYMSDYELDEEEQAIIEETLEEQ